MPVKSEDILDTFYSTALLRITKANNSTIPNTEAANVVEVSCRASLLATSEL